MLFWSHGKIVGWCGLCNSLVCLSLSLCLGRCFCLSLFLFLFYSLSFSFSFIHTHTHTHTHTHRVSTILWWTTLQCPAQDGMCRSLGISQEGHSSLPLKQAWARHYILHATDLPTWTNHILIFLWIHDLPIFLFFFFFFFVCSLKTCKTDVLTGSRKYPYLCDFQTARQLEIFLYRVLPSDGWVYFRSVGLRLIVKCWSFLKRSSWL